MGARSAHLSSTASPSHWASRATGLALAFGLLVAGAGLGGSADAAAGHRATAISATSTYGTLAVSTSKGVDFFPPGDQGASATPSREIDFGTADDQLHEINALAYSATGDLWVADYDAAVSPTDRVLEFAPDATGAAHAIATVTSSAIGLHDIFGMAVAPDGDLWVTAAVSGTWHLVRFAAGQTGDVTPATDITGAMTGLEASVGVAVSPDGSEVWVAQNTVGTQLEAFAASASGNVAPTTVVTGLGTDSPAGALALTIDSLGNASVLSAGEIVTFAPPSNRRFPAGTYTLTPTVALDGPDTGVSNADGEIALAPDGELAVPADGSTQVPFVSLAHSGDVPPLSTLTPAATTGITYFGAEAFYDAAPTVPRAVTLSSSYSAVHLHWAAPASTGGALEGYLVSRRSTPTGAYVLVKYTATPNLTDVAVKKKHEYSYQIVAVNSRGISPASRPVAAFTGKRPGAPRHVRAKAGRHSIAVSWRAPKHPGVPAVSHYLVQIARCKLGPSTCVATTFTVSGRHDHRTVKHLSVGRRYFVRVLARNLTGTSAPSARTHAKPRS